VSNWRSARRLWSASPRVDASRPNIGCRTRARLLRWWAQFRRFLLPCSDREAQSKVGHGATVEAGVPLRDLSDEPRSRTPFDPSPPMLDRERDASSRPSYFSFHPANAHLSAIGCELVRQNVGSGGVSTQPSLCNKRAMRFSPMRGLAVRLIVAPLINCDASA